MQSLQLINFKLAKHKAKLLEYASKMLQESHGQQKPDDKMLIPIGELRKLINGSLKHIGIVLMTYDQYKSGAVLQENDPYCVEEMENFIFQAILLEKERQKPRKASLLRQERQGDQKKQVRFFDQMKERFKMEGVGYRPFFFVQKLDKFLQWNLDVVMQPLDTEWQEYKEMRQKQRKDLEN